jgi:hypothetical protein
MRLRYDEELDEAVAWSGWFCRVSGFLNGRQYWAEWQRIIDRDRRALLEEGDGEGLLDDYRFWRDAEPEVTLAVIRTRGLKSPEALGWWASGRAARCRPTSRSSDRSKNRSRVSR